MGEVHNYLKVYRKRSPLSQRDVAFLLSAPDCTHLCRCEQGERTPPLEMLLVYHLVFDTSIEMLFQRQRSAVKENLMVRIKDLAIALKDSPMNEKTEKRVNYLRSVFRRLIKDKTT